MSKAIPKNQFGYGAGKGDYPRPVDRKVFRSNFDGIQGLGKVSGKLTRSKGNKKTYKY